MPSAPTLLVGCCLVMLAVAGCVGGPSTGQPASSTSTPEAPTAESSTPTPECALSNATVVAYETLSTTQQQAFEEALSEGPLRMIEGDPWGATTYYQVSAVQSPPLAGSESYVRRNGTLYHVTFGPPGFAQGTTLRLSSISSPGNQTVISLENKSGRGWEFVKYTAEQGTIARGLVDEVPVERGDVLAYRGQYYEVGMPSINDFNTLSMDVYEKVC